MDYPIALEKLDDVYNNPQYYSGYYLRSITCNLRFRGSVPAEQNHSSIIRFLGESASYTITEQIVKLLERAEVHYNATCRAEDLNNLQAQKHLSKFDGHLKKEDMLARRTLSYYAYTNLFLKNLKKSSLLQHALEPDGGSHVVWSVDELKPSTNSVRVIVGERCNCQDRIDYDAQCACELTIVPQFNPKHYNPRWLNTSTFNQMYPLLAPVKNRLGVTTILNTKSIESNHTFTRPSHELTIPNNDPYHQCIKDPSQNVTYNEMVIQCQELCRTVQNDQVQCRAVISIVNEWTNKLRRKEVFETVFVNSIVHTNDKDESYTSTSSTKEPLHAITRVASTAKASKRYVSAREFHGKKSTKRYNESTQKRLRSDVEFVPPPRSNKRTCVLCGCCGRSQFECPRITEVYNCVTLKNGCPIVREQLCIRLSNVSAMPIYPREISDNRVIMTKCPKKMKALVLHRRLAIAVTVTQEQLPSNICIECTFLGLGGVPNPDFTLQLFSVGAIMRYIGNSANNLIGSQIV